MPEDKPKFRLADAEDIAGMTTAFTLPGRLAKQLAERQRRIDQRRAKGLSELSVERREDTGIDKPWHIPIQTCHWFRIKPATLKWECFSRDNFTLPPGITKPGKPPEYPHRREREHAECL